MPEIWTAQAPDVNFQKNIALCVWRFPQTKIETGRGTSNYRIMEQTSFSLVCKLQIISTMKLQETHNFHCCKLFFLIHFPLVIRTREQSYFRKYDIFFLGSKFLDQYLMHDFFHLRIARGTYCLKLIADIKL